MMALALVHRVVLASHNEVQHAGQGPRNGASAPHHQEYQPVQLSAHEHAMAHADGLRQQVTYELQLKMPEESISSVRAGSLLRISLAKASILRIMCSVLHLLLTCASRRGQSTNFGREHHTPERW